MPDIISSKKMPEGIQVLWAEGNAVKSESFNFQDLIDQKINALDLLDRPVAYKVDPKTHRITPKS